MNNRLSNEKPKIWFQSLSQFSERTAIPNNNFPSLWLYINLWAIRLGATSERAAIIHQSGISLLKRVKWKHYLLWWWWLLVWILWEFWLVGFVGGDAFSMHFALHFVSPKFCRPPSSVLYLYLYLTLEEESLPSPHRPRGDYKHWTIA